MKKPLFILALLAMAACNQPAKEEKKLIVKAHSESPMDSYIYHLPAGDIPFELPERFTLLAGGEAVPYQREEDGGITMLINRWAGGDIDFEFVPNDTSIQFDRRTQALIKVQQGTFDPEKPKAVDHPYQMVDRYVVPPNLVSQNNWVRFEGPIWESGPVGYRLYADGRNLIDIFGKKTQALVLDTVMGNYHEVSAWGADVLKVGGSLGMGSPAIVLGDGTITPLSGMEGKTISVENKALWSGVKTLIPRMAVDGDTLDLAMGLGIYADQRWSEVSLQVAEGSLPKLATGIVRHPNTTFGQGTQDGWHYAWSWGKQSDQGHYLGMAIFVEEAYNPEYIEADTLNYLFHFTPQGNQAKYHIMAAWELEPGFTGSQDEFEGMVKSQIKLWTNKTSIKKS